LRAALYCPVYKWASPDQNRGLAAHIGMKSKNTSENTNA
jgi:hypothetical protein